ncbi:MAG: IS110 family transposase [Nocardioides sp.]|nr:IS110 family transposase [Nocardioides sp.]
MRNQRTSVGLDVHALSVVGFGIDEDTGEVFERRLTPAPDDILGWLRSLPQPAKAVYEAGPTGFGLYRALQAGGVACVVAAPSKLQRPAGDRVKTDARDAMHLARLLRLDEVTAVTVPAVEQEAARDLVRAREDARGDLMRARHRLSKLLLRHGIVYSGGRAWTGAHDVWLRSQRFGQPALQAAFESDYETMVLTRGRRDRLDSAITEMADDSVWTPTVHRLCCLRGISTLTGFSLAVEIGDWDRFTGRSIGAYMGLVPSEHSSGTSRSQGSITKTGNGHVRRLLVEAAWHHRKVYRAPSTVMGARWANASPAARARGHAGNHRLHHRWEQFTARKKRPVVANVAVARELAGWCWSLATLEGG